MLALCVLTSEVFIVLLLIILLFEYFLINKNKSRFFIKIIGITIILIAFIYTLITKNLFNDWVVHLKISKIILQDANLIDVFLFFLKIF